MDGLQILEILKKVNPWFKTNEIPSVLLESFKRREFAELEKDLDKTDMATLIIGGRRVGKSVLMYQLMDSLLRKGVGGKRILFIQGDNPILREYLGSGKILNFLLNIFQNHISEQPLNELSETLYIFIDEAQAIPDWELEVKTLIDLKYKIKFVITGSSSIELRRGSQNPLTGRVKIQVIQPFSFSDFARYQIVDKHGVQFSDKIKKLSDSFKSALFDGNITAAHKQAFVAETIVKKYSLKEKFEEYLFLGGFPWVISNHVGNDVPKYLRDLLTTTISKDILTQVEIRDTQAFERLMVNLCLNAGNVINYKTFADVLGIEERTVSKYIDYYIESHWAFISSPYVFHKKPDSIKTEKKVYVIDSGIINTLAFKDSSDLTTDRQYRGHVLENVIHNHLLSFKQSMVGSFQNSIPFWIEEETKKEIDFIFEIKGGIIPIESKSKISYDGSDLETLENFVNTKTSSKFGIISTEDTLEIRGKILLIPYTSLVLLL